VELANNVYDALSGLADARGAAIQQYGTTFASAARQYSLTMTPANAAYQIHVGAAATQFNQDVQRLQSSAASAALDARANYVVTSYSDHAADLQNADTGADLDDFQQSVVSADLARVQAAMSALQTHTTASNGQLKVNYATKVLAGDIEPGFSIDLAHKDLSLVLAAANAAKVPMPMAAVAREGLSLARAGGFGSKDFSGLLDHWCERAGLEKIRFEQP